MGGRNTRVTKNLSFIAFQAIILHFSIVQTKPVQEEHQILGFQFKSKHLTKTVIPKAIQFLITCLI